MEENSVYFIFYLYTFSHYTIVAPDTIQPDYDYAVTTTMYDNVVPITIKIAIAGPFFNERKTIVIPSCGSETIHFHIPVSIQDDDSDYLYELQAEGVNGFVFKESKKLRFKCEKPKVYIQTDKAMYKPGDLVQYRIMALDENIRPAKIKERINLCIQDSSCNQIKQINDISLTRGIYRGDFQLSEQPVLGEWAIDITTGEQNKSKTTKTFEVAKYILPKFSVDIEAPRYVAVLDKVLKIVVRSTYTYGKPVKGKLMVTAELDPSSDPESSDSDSSHHDSSAHKILDIIDEKGEVEFNLIDDLHLLHHSHYYDVEVKITATMKEAFTGLEQSTTKTIDLLRSRYNIKVLKKSRGYIAHKPFEIKVVIKKLNGLPVTDAKSTAKLILSHERRVGSDMLFESVVDTNGVATFQLKLTKCGFYTEMKVMYEEEIESFRGFMVEALAPDEEFSSESEISKCPSPKMEYRGRRPLEIFPQTAK